MLTQKQWRRGLDGGSRQGKKGESTGGQGLEGVQKEWREICCYCGQSKAGQGCLTRNFLFCFQWFPWAFVAMWASVTIRIRSHSSWVGSRRSHIVLCCSSRRRRCRFSSINFRLANRLLSSSTTGERIKKKKRIHGNRRPQTDDECICRNSS